MGGIKIRNWCIKSYIGIINEKMKGSSSEEEEIGIHKCRRRSRVEIMNREVKGWILSSKQEKAPPELTNTQEEIRLEQMKREVKRAVLEWDDFVIQGQLKYLIYVDRLSRGYPKKDKFIDELNFRHCMRLKRNTTSKFFVGIKSKKESLLFIQNILMPVIYYYIHLFTISNINQTWFRTCQDK